MYVSQFSVLLKTVKNVSPIENCVYFWFIVKFPFQINTIKCMFCYQQVYECYKFRACILADSNFNLYSWQRLKYQIQVTTLLLVVNMWLAFRRKLTYIRNFIFRLLLTTTQYKLITIFVIFIHGTETSKLLFWSFVVNNCVCVYGLVKTMATTYYCTMILYCIMQ